MHLKILRKMGSVNLLLAPKPLIGKLERYRKRGLPLLV